LRPPRTQRKTRLLRGLRESAPVVPVLRIVRTHEPLDARVTAKVPTAFARTINAFVRATRS